MAAADTFMNFCKERRDGVWVYAAEVGSSKGLPVESAVWREPKPGRSELELVRGFLVLWQDVVFEIS